MVKAKIIKDYSIQSVIELKVNNQLICKHKADFAVLTLGNKTEIHEFKGAKTPAWKLKYKLFKALYPRIKYKIIEYKDL
jgi:hypothetical protein